MFKRKNDNMEDEKNSCEDCAYAQLPSYSKECMRCMQDTEHPNFTPFGGNR